VAISTTTNFQIVLGQADSCTSNVILKVPYTLWIGTDVTSQSNIVVPAIQNTVFYDVMKFAEILDPNNFRYVSRVSSLTELGEYQVDLGRFGYCHCV
jgi:hypothetical protein